MFPETRKWCTRPAKKAGNGDVLLSIRAPVGPTNLAPEECCIGRGLAALSPSVGIEARFILYQLRHLESRLASLASGTTFEAVTGPAVRSFSVMVPPTGEQRRIVTSVEELLSELDAGVAALRRVTAKSGKYKASMIMAAIEGRLTEAWREEHPDEEPGSALLERILRERRARWQEEQLAKYEAKQQKPPEGWSEKYPQPEVPDPGDLPELPRGWCWATVSQLLREDMCTGISVPGRAEPPGVPSLRLSAMSDDGLDFADRKYLPVGDELAKKLAIRANDFFVCRGNGSIRLVGRGSLAQDPGEVIVFPDLMIRLRLAPMGRLIDYVSLAWASRLLRRQIEARARTTAGIYKISQADVRRFVLPLPPLAEQEAIVGTLQASLSCQRFGTTEAGSAVARSRQLQESILSRAFSGGLVPQDSSEEPASVLLGRIRAKRAASEAATPARKSRAAMKSARTGKAANLIPLPLDVPGSE